MVIDIYLDWRKAFALLPALVARSGHGADARDGRVTTVERAARHTHRNTLACLVHLSQSMIRLTPARVRPPKTIFLLQTDFHVSLRTLCWEWEADSIEPIASSNSFSK